MTTIRVRQVYTKSIYRDLTILSNARPTDEDDGWVCGGALGNFYALRELGLAEESRPNMKNIWGELVPKKHYRITQLGRDVLAGKVQPC